MSALLSSAPARSLNTEEGVTLPLNYAEVGGKSHHATSRCPEPQQAARQCIGPRRDRA